MLLLAFALVTVTSAFLASLLTWHYAAVRVEASEVGSTQVAVTLTLGPYPWSESSVALVPAGAILAGSDDVPQA